MYKNIYKNIKYVLFALIGIAALPSCNTTKFLGEDEALLKDIDIKFKHLSSIDATDLKGELEQFYLQKPNKKFFFTPREHYTLKYGNRDDISWFNRSLTRMVGEEPSIVDTSLLIQTAVDMQNYLRNKKGYYEAEVDYDIEFDKNIVNTLYTTDLGARSSINTIEYITRDEQLKPLIDSLKKNSIIKVGDPIDALTLELEKQRLLQDLQNHGYADFSLSYIDVKGDSSALDKKVDLFFEILNPAGRNHHKQFAFGDIHVYTDYRQGQLLNKTDSIFYRGKYFHKENDQYILRNSAIDNHIYFNSGEQYNRTNHYKSILKLSQLSTYKFTKLNPRIDLEQDSIIHYDILLTPYKHRWISDLGSYLFYSTINTSGTGQQLFGIGASSGLQNRNFLGGSEQLSLTAETALEFDLGQLLGLEAPQAPTPLINTLTINLGANLKFPKLVDGLATFNLLRKFSIIDEPTYKKIKTNTTTDVGINFNLQDIAIRYNIQSINSYLRHEYEPATNKRFTLTQLAFNLNSYEIKQAFVPTIQNNRFLELSFEDNLFAGFLFRDFSYYVQSNVNKNKSYFAFLGNFELSGGETWLANKIYNVIADQNAVFGVSGFDFANFIKLELDGRYYKQVSATSTLVTRLNLGVATGYADNGVVPYIKQFFVGGPSSIRAWQTRELGPGYFQLPGVVPPEANPVGQFFQAGDFKLEFNAEYRFDIYWIIEGAVFLDGGNVWSLKEDTRRPGSKLTSEFIDQIALGTGWGIRWDFSYFNIRFDFGYRIRNPFEDTQGSHWQSPFGQGIFGNVNVAVNYPF